MTTQWALCIFPNIINKIILKIRAPIIRARIIRAPIIRAPIIRAPIIRARTIRAYIKFALYKKRRFSKYQKYI